MAVRLEPGETCPDCRSADAWQRYGGGVKLVIDPRTIAKAEQRRVGEAAGESAWTRARHYLPTAAALLVGAIAMVFVARLLQPAALARLATVVDRYKGLAGTVTALGALALVAAAVAFVRLRRGRLFRSWLLVSLNLVAMTTGSAAMLVGGFHLLATAGAFRDIHGQPWLHVAMPDIATAAAPSPLAREVMAATTVILATNAEGDMRGMAIGSGNVISRSLDRAWVLTNSHVAMPFRGTGSFRDPSDALPVLVYFADGRSEKGRVVWVSGPPLDAVVLSVPIANAPAPVDIAADAAHADKGTSVFFVPNPFRRGWRSHTGEVIERKLKQWRPGGINLIYTNLPVEPGDSGGGLFDGRGRLIGINTWAQFDEDRKARRIVPKGISLPPKTLQEIRDLISSHRLPR